MTQSDEARAQVLQRTQNATAETAERSPVLRSRQTMCLTGVPRSLRLRVPRSLRLQGQVTLEYLIIFAVVAVVTLVTVTTFDDAIKNALQGFFNAAADKITK